MYITYRSKAKSEAKLADNEISYLLRKEQATTMRNTHLSERYGSIYKPKQSQLLGRRSL